MYSIGPVEQSIFKNIIDINSLICSEFGESYTPKEPKVIDKRKFEFGPEKWFIEGSYKEYIEPKEIYKNINPNNEYCEFVVLNGDKKVYSFFHNKVGSKVYKHYTVVSVSNIDF